MNENKSFFYSTGLCTTIPSLSFICEDHFESTLVKEKDEKKSLRANAVPTIFVRKTKDKTLNSSNEISCRFCLKTLNDSDIKQSINHSISSQFFSITQRKLKSSKDFSQIICEICYKSVQSAFTFRSKLIAHQEYLENTHNEESDDTVGSSGGIEEIIKVEVEDKATNETVHVFYEEYLDPDLIDTEIEVIDNKSIALKTEVVKNRVIEKRKLCPGMKLF